MRHHSAAAMALGDKLKATARNHNIDVNTYASRHVAERVVHYLGTALSTPFMLTGGLNFAQDIRETRDADLVAVRRISNAEFQRALILMRPWLEAEGITLHAASATPKVIDLDGGKEVDRWKIEATAGTLRGNTQVDFGFSNGPDAFPDGIEWKEMPTLMKGGPVLRARCQPLAAAAAEKMLAIFLQPIGDYRVKHLADVVNSDLWDGVDCRAVAREIARTVRHRGIPAGVITCRPPELAWSSIVRREAAWTTHMEAGKTDLTLDQAWIDVNGLWCDVYAELKKLPRSHFRRSTLAPTLVDRIIAGERPKSAPAYKPF
ncbi:nucleotidyl transferase AbiEii/AbiGii toxin family protein [Neorhizobium tomejilense]|uniref:nucleotidyl transferase AbiEii/AbiGii toxin family protein n=1 Tax=Neorhizobium tomejilense TaxID=2093828 RepID=UPI003ECC70E4